jgi:urease accessory protein
MINTAGGVTGGDQFSTAITAHENARISVTTQAAERIYRTSGAEAGQMQTNLTVAAGAQLFWLPQETILFEGSRLKRRLDVDLDANSRFLMVEPLIFGRTASGETLQDCVIDDTVSITMAGDPLYLDRIRMTGDIDATLQRNAVANGARAVASIVLVDPDASQFLTAVRDLMPPTGGASLLTENTLVVRLLATDSFALRQTLFAILRTLTRDAMPKNWSL